MTTPIRPAPFPDDVTEGFWESVRARRLSIQRCAACTRFNHAPSLTCPTCGSEDLGFEEVSGYGTVHSFTVLEHPPGPGFAELLPLVVVIVELVEQPGLLLVADLLDAEPAQARIGAAVQVDFEEISEDCVLPQFRLTEA
ncbi:OB-fold domain-containing protein [Gordonia sp. HY285]|uniref:Zn-ribbon domain-containing OB-fold protein n=1 Tax=Gordonia liuliyuniae TaxID=2911517 RepID=UPI001F377BE1|nr:OB-fold domain-containing protein [Gordonia liuliyuniae]MCF8609177.1 OB-fold domain-containing protein [Gordonia liuliyuniae]